MITDKIDMSTFITLKNDGFHFLQDVLYFEYQRRTMAIYIQEKR